jgi:hypothetical protein
MTYRQYVGARQGAPLTVASSSQEHSCGPCGGRDIDARTCCAPHTLMGVTAPAWALDAPASAGCAGTGRDAGLSPAAALQVQRAGPGHGRAPVRQPYRARDGHAHVPQLAAAQQRHQLCRHQAAPAPRCGDQVAPPRCPGQTRGLARCQAARAARGARCFIVVDSTTRPSPCLRTRAGGRRRGARAGLALHKGLVYAAFGSHCDRPPYYPFLFAFDARTLAIRSFWTTPVLICAPAHTPCGIAVRQPRRARTPPACPGLIRALWA